MFLCQTGNMLKLIDLVFDGEIQILTSNKEHLKEIYHSYVKHCCKLVIFVISALYAVGFIFISTGKVK